MAQRRIETAVFERVFGSRERSGFLLDARAAGMTKVVWPRLIKASRLQGLLQMASAAQCE